MFNLDYLHQVQIACILICNVTSLCCIMHHYSGCSVSFILLTIRVDFILGTSVIFLIARIVVGT